MKRRLKTAVLFLAAILIIGPLIVFLRSLSAQEPIRFSDPWDAPEVVHQDTQGNEHKLADYEEQALVVNFWATWCPPCIKEMPSLQRLSDQVGGEGIHVLGINIGEDAQTINAFAELYGIRFPLLIDESMASPALWRLRGLPTTALVNTRGKIVATVLGEREWDDPLYVRQIRTLKER